LNESTCQDQVIQIFVCSITDETGRTGGQTHGLAVIVCQHTLNQLGRRSFAVGPCNGDGQTLDCPKPSSSSLMSALLRRTLPRAACSWQRG